jgi:hypothetical protein
VSLFVILLSFHLLVKSSVHHANLLSTYSELKRRHVDFVDNRLRKHRSNLCCIGLLQIQIKDWAISVLIYGKSAQFHYISCNLHRDTKLWIRHKIRYGGNVWRAVENTQFHGEFKVSYREINPSPFYYSSSLRSTGSQACLEFIFSFHFPKVFLGLIIIIFCADYIFSSFLIPSFLIWPSLLQPSSIRKCLTSADCVKLRQDFGHALYVLQMSGDGRSHAAHRFWGKNYKGFFHTSQ